MLILVNPVKEFFNVVCEFDGGFQCEPGMT